MKEKGKQKKNKKRDENRYENLFSYFHFKLSNLHFLFCLIFYSLLYISRLYIFFLFKIWIIICKLQKKERHTKVVCYCNFTKLNFATYNYNKESLFLLKQILLISNFKKNSRRNFYIHTYA